MFAEVCIASAPGGPIPIDSGSMAEGFFTPAAKKFMHDGEAIDKLAHTIKISTVPRKIIYTKLYKKLRRIAILLRRICSGLRRRFLCRLAGIHSFLTTPKSMEN